VKFCTDRQRRVLIQDMRNIAQIQWGIWGFSIGLDVIEVVTTMPKI
jgi:hypothetical protein